MLAILLCAPILGSRQHSLPFANVDIEAVEVNSLRQGHRVRARWRPRVSSISISFQGTTLPKDLQGMSVSSYIKSKFFQKSKSSISDLISQLPLYLPCANHCENRPKALKCLT